jgi:hypothetical protein
VQAALSENFSLSIFEGRDVHVPVLMVHGEEDDLLKFLGGQSRNLLR